MDESKIKISSQDVEQSLANRKDAVRDSLSSFIIRGLQQHGIWVDSEVENLILNSLLPAKLAGADYDLANTEHNVLLLKGASLQTIVGLGRNISADNISGIVDAVFNYVKGKAGRVEAEQDKIS